MSMSTKETGDKLTDLINEAHKTGCFNCCYLSNGNETDLKEKCNFSIWYNSEGYLKKDIITNMLNQMEDSENCTYWEEK